MKETPSHLLLFLFFFIFSISPFKVTAADNDSICIRGRIADAITRVDIDSVKLLIRDKIGAWTSDTILTHDQVDRAKGLALGIPAQYIPIEIYYVCTVPRPGAYIVTTHKKGYADREVEISVPARQGIRKTKEWAPKDILLQRFRERALDEAVVQATKVMMVHRGDTVVFNADYFELSQGSMLDELISRMPGLEIKSGGQIFYNGNRLNSLLINGKDFFSGDPAVALQNLPAYTVKEVKVFHKAAAGERFAKYRKDEHEDPNTLDVLLKKEYSHGWITNYTLAGGLPLERKPWNDVKYLARLFALHYGNRSRLGIFGNFNNVNDANAATTDGDWWGGFSDQGRQQTAWGGLLYSIDSKNRKVSYNLDLQAKHQTSKEESQASTTTFLNVGDVFRRSSSATNQSGLHLNIDNALRWEGEHAELELHANGSYTNEDNNGYTRSAQFSADPKDAYRGASLDSIFVGPSSPRLAQWLTNRLEQSSLLHRQSWEQTTTAELSFREPLLYNNGILRMGYEYHGQSSKNFEHYDLRYNNPGNRDNDYRNRYTRSPFSEFHFTSDFNYWFDNMLSESIAKWLSLSICYSIDLRRESGERQLYNLHNITERPSMPSEGSGEILPLGTLPSMANWQAQTLSASDSYVSSSLKMWHYLAPSISFGKSQDKLGSISLTPWVNFHRNCYDDTRSTTNADHTYTFFIPSVSWNRHLFLEKDGIMDQRHSFSIDYKLSRKAPEANLLLNICDASNPLSITLGNGSLRSSTTHSATAVWQYTRVSRECHLSIKADYYHTQNAIAMGYTYDNTTGVYTHQPQNVNGNWKASLEVRFSHPLDNKRRLHLFTNLNGSYLNSVDFVNGQRSEVRNQIITLNAELRYKFGEKLNLTFKAVPNFQYATSDRPGFIKRSTWDVNYGPQLNYKPVRDLTLSTNLTIYSRRGYDDATMNEDNFVWNASVDYAFDFRRVSYKEKGKGPRPWSLKLEAFDLLRQLTNTRRVLNSQGITETWVNSLPSYLMLHLTYRWNKQPKNNK